MGLLPAVVLKRVKMPNSEGSMRIAYHATVSGSACTRDSAPSRNGATSSSLPCLASMRARIPTLTITAPSWRNVPRSFDAGTSLSVRGPLIRVTTISLMAWSVSRPPNPRVVVVHTTAELTRETIQTCPPSRPPRPVDELLEVPGIRSIDLHRYRARVNLAPGIDRDEITRQV